MVAIYVLDVPEFASLVEAAKQRPDWKLGKLASGYFKIEHPEELVFERKALGVKPAVWYGLFTGGLDGRIVQFDRDRVRILPQTPAERN